MWPDFTEYLLDFNLLVSDSISLIEINSNIFYPPCFFGSAFIKACKTLGQPDLVLFILTFKSFHPERKEKCGFAHRLSSAWSF